MRRLLVFTVLAVVFASVVLAAQSPADIRIQKDIIYGHAGGADLKLDMASPTGPGPFPVILFFHGGGWQAGDKSHGHHWLRRFVGEGYVGVSVEYRFAPAFPWPAQVQDAKAAVRYIRANAAVLKIDPNRIGVMGESAGGYLAKMVGVAGPDDGVEGDGGNAGVSSGVQAVVSYYSASDFTLPRAPLSAEVAEGVMKYYGKTLKEVLADFIGTSNPSDSLLKKMSVFPYVDPGDPPVLSFHGDVDPFVAVRQGQRLDSVLTRANVRHELVIVRGGAHGWKGEMEAKTTQQMLEFFRKALR